MTTVLDAHQARALQAARDAVELLYRDARELVFDVVAPDALGAAVLTPEQEAALRRLLEAEDHLETLRHG
jgi:hypothetical protein